MGNVIAQFEAEVKSFNTKPIRKNKTEGTLTLVTESYCPGDDFRDLFNKNGKLLKIIIMESDNEDAINTEARDR